MSDQRKTKAQLIAELQEARQQIAAWQSNGHRQQIEPTDSEIQHKVREMDLAHQQTIIYARELTKEVQERRLTEGALRESEMNLKAILDNSDQAFFLVDEDYVIKTINRFARLRSEAIFGRMVEEGDSVLDFIPAGQIETFQHNFAIAFRGQPYRAEINFKGVDQTNYWFEYTYNPVLDKDGQVVQICFGANDITKRKRLEARLSGIYELGQELTLLRDEETIIERVLKMAGEMLRVELAGYGRIEETTNQLVYQGGVLNGQPRMMDMRVSLAAGQGLGMAVLQQGQPINVPDLSQEKRYEPGDYPKQSALYVPLKIGQRPLGVLYVESDERDHFTPADQQLFELLADQAAVAIENARLFEEGQEQYRHLQQSQLQLVQIEKMAALGRLVASLAHEINNPLQSLGSCLTLLEEVLAEEAVDQELLPYLKIAGEEIGRIASIVRRMRDFYRPLPHSQPVPSTDSLEDVYYSLRGEVQTINIQELLQSVIQLAGKQLQHSGIKVQTIWDSALPLIQGNPDYLKQVGLNLILNAIDAMPEGGVLQIQTRTTQLVGEGDVIQDAVCIDFKDTGVGISAEVQSRLFEPLFTTKEHGSGFGLYTSSKIIESHRGEILVESSVDAGTIFTVRLPIEQGQYQ